MSSIRSHVYTALFVAGGIVMLLGAYIVSNRAALSPTTDKITWGTGVVVDPRLNNSTPSENSVPSVSIGGQDYSYSSPLNTATTKNPSQATTETFDWSAFQKALTQPTKTTDSTASTDSSIQEAYSFIPSGLFSTNNIAGVSADETALHKYGNALGVPIQGYEESHSNQTSILTDHAQDRGNPLKQAALRKLGEDLAVVGEEIDAVGAPAETGKTVSDLANSYRDIGKKLALVADTKTDEEFVKAIQIYNTAAEHFASSYVNVALMFQAHGTTFSKNEPGSVFMIPSTSGGL